MQNVLRSTLLHANKTTKKYIQLFNKRKKEKDKNILFVNNRIGGVIKLMIYDL
jgi:hypothetical protein